MGSACRCSRYVVCVDAPPPPPPNTHLAEVCVMYTSTGGGLRLLGCHAGHPAECAARPRLTLHHCYTVPHTRTFQVGMPCNEHMCDRFAAVPGTAAWQSAWVAAGLYLAVAAGVLLMLCRR